MSELGVTVIRKATRLLGFGCEFRNFGACFIFLVRCEETFAEEVYAKNIGLIYKDFSHWVFQPRNSTYPAGYIEGYSIRLRMISHN